MQKLKRAVIKEELVAITNDPIEAVILNQFIYWSERVYDFDKFINEEQSRANNEGMEINFDLCNGWIYKKAEDLNEEIMFNLSVPTIRKYIKNLVEKGYLCERRNPKYKWDKTYQYRVDLIKIANDLHNLGYTLEGYKYNLNELNSNLKNLNSQLKNFNAELENLTAISEITLETTLETTHTQETKNCKSVCVDVEKILGEKIGEKKIQELINTKGIDAVNQYLSKWDKYRHHANSTQASYFIYAVQNELPIPQAKKTTYTAQAKPIAQFNFDERDYKEEEMEKYYVNVFDT